LQRSQTFSNTRSFGFVGAIDAASGRISQRGQAMPYPKDHRIQLSPELEKRRRISVKFAAELRGVSEPVFRERFGHLIEQASPKRQVVQLGKVLDE
jgi:hypothetical protein